MHLLIGMLFFYHRHLLFRCVLFGLYGAKIQLAHFQPGASFLFFRNTIHQYICDQNFGSGNLVCEDIKIVWVTDSNLSNLCVN